MATMSDIKLSILICTIDDRKDEFYKLVNRFNALIGDLPIEVINLCDNRQMTIGDKRNKLLDMANGEYIVFFDDDDWPEGNYIIKIMEAIEQQPDTVGMLISMTTNGFNPQTCCHRLKYKRWADGVDGYDYVRSVTHFNPVRRKLALKAKFPSIRFGEDHEYSKRITLLCKSEVFINEHLFQYRYTTNLNHKEKYGIR